MNKITIWLGCEKLAEADECSISINSIDISHVSIMRQFMTERFDYVEQIKESIGAAATDQYAQDQYLLKKLAEFELRLQALELQQSTPSINIADV